MAEERLTREFFDACMKSISKQGSVPRHVCKFDGHVFAFNPFGFSRCIYCGASEADEDRPKR